MSEVLGETLNVADLPLQRGQGVELDSAPRSEKRDDDGETDRDLSRSDGNDEEDQNLTVRIWKTSFEIEAREGDERKAGCGEHHLKAHEDDDEIPTNQDTSEPDGKEESADEKIGVEARHRSMCECLRLASMLALTGRRRRLEIRWTQQTRRSLLLLRRRALSD